MTTFYITNRFTAYLLTGLLIACSTVTNSAQAELLYNILDFGTLGGGYSKGYGINASGQVVGDSDGRAFVTDQAGHMIDLGASGADNSYGLGINASGQVVGYLMMNGIRHAFITNSNGQIIDLGGLGREKSVAAAINDGGQVTGTYSTNYGGFGYVDVNAFVYNPNGQVVNLGGSFSEGRGINVSGQVTGNNAGTAFVTDSSGQLVDLGSLDPNNANSIGYGINASGQVTGWSSIPGSAHAFVTNSSGQMIDLHSFGSNYSSEGLGINSTGQVVGSFRENGYPLNPTRAFVTNNGIMEDLNTLLAPSASGWVIEEARGINDIGQITGTGKLNGQTRAFLLTPVAVPVPAAAWLFGSAIVGFIGFNRRKTGPKQFDTNALSYSHLFGGAYAALWLAL